MLQDEAVRSAQIYLDYLLAHRAEGLGLVRARVRSVQSSLLWFHETNEVFIFNI